MIAWPELLLAGSLALLLLQLFPSGARAILDVLDVRAWTWRNYAVASVLWIIFFIVLRAWRNQFSD